MKSSCTLLPLFLACSLSLGAVACSADTGESGQANDEYVDGDDPGGKADSANAEAKTVFFRSQDVLLRADQGLEPQLDDA